MTGSVRYRSVVFRVLETKSIETCISRENCPWRDFKCLSGDILDTTHVVALSSWPLWVVRTRCFGGDHELTLWDPPARILDAKETPVFMLSHLQVRQICGVTASGAVASVVGGGGGICEGIATSGAGLWIATR